MKQQPRRAPSTPIDIAGPKTYQIDVVGVSRYQDVLEEICGGRTSESVKRIFDALLVPEDDNSHDSNAIRVDIQGMTVGYLSRDRARQYRKSLADAGCPGVTVRCSALIVGGWDKGPQNRGHFGVRLDLPTQQAS